MSLRQAAEQIIAWYAEGQRPTGDDIVDTLREALAQPERRCEAGVSLQDLWDCWDAVHSGKQEPVAWKGVTGDHGFNFLGFHEQPGMEPLYLHPAPIPEGWQLVPKEPTENMIKLGAYAERYSGVYGIYKAMLAAAPKPEDV